MDTIIDGYNLIFQCGLEGRTRSPISLQRARDRLIATLRSRLSDEQCARITIVYDAKRLPIKETEAVSQKHGITVIFAVDHDEADTLIEELILKHSAPKQLTVVSSDHRLHKAALRRKATPIDSDVWFDRLERQQQRPASAASGLVESDGDDKPVPDELTEIDWQQEFGLDVETEDTKQPGKESTYNPFPPGYGDDLLDE
jgi:predicted RNA-binding protein with PIN domain